MTTLRQYTNPADISARDAAVLREAKTGIDFASYTLTHPAPIAALAAVASKQLPIRLYLDRSEIEAEAHHDDTGSRLPIHVLMALPHVTIKVKRSLILMHLKAYCVDGKILRSGSANFSPLGESQQDNEASWDDDPGLIAQFTEKFNAMWNRPDNLTVAQAIDLNKAQGVISTHQHRIATVIA